MRQRAHAYVCALCALVGLLLQSRPTSAHPTPGSAVFIDFTLDGARIEQDVPVEELQRALKRPLLAEGEAPEQLAVRQRVALLDYARQHLGMTSVAKRRVWHVEAVDVVGHTAADGPRLRFSFKLHAPAGKRAVSAVQLHDDMITHEVMSHYTTVYVRSDWTSGVLESQPRLVGVIRAYKQDLSIARRGGFWRGLKSTLELGMAHIATGTDHLMFLFALVLVAPVAARAGRWQRQPSQRVAVFALLRVVTAFTIGHSITLALGVLCGLRLPAALVEASIAASILITAVHAIRPLFPRREPWIAGLFGLIHGLAFASTLPERDLGRVQAAWTLLGFNLGIELAQLGLLCAVVPWLLILARTRAYPASRVFGAGLACVLAVGWLSERALSLPNPTAPTVAWIEAHPLWLLGALALASLTVRGLDRDHYVVATNNSSELLGSRIPSDRPAK
jgi:hydrogenase/urease accessory protein HupE